MTPVRSRVLGRAAVAGAVLAAFALGVGVGRAGDHGPRQAAAAQPTTSGSVVDEAADRIAEQAATPVSRADLDRAAVGGMLRVLGDRWSTYYTPQQADAFGDALEGRYSGVGVWLRAAGAGLEVASVLPGSPAAVAGLAVGDVLTGVDGVGVAGEPADRAAARLHGPDGSVARVAVTRAGRPMVLAVVRRAVATQDVTVTPAPGGVALVRVAAMTRGVGREVRQALASHPGGGVVLDLRGNGGGLLDEAVEVASAFLDGGRVVSYDRRGQAPVVLEAVGDGDTTSPVVVLVDHGTASAAEVVAGALQDRGRAVVVGSRTYGKGTVQEPTRLSDGSALTLTVGRYRTPSGRTLDGTGIDPDLLVADGSAPEVAERRALEVLGGLVAALPGRGRG